MAKDRAANLVSRPPGGSLENVERDGGDQAELVEVAIRLVFAGAVRGVGCAYCGGFQRAALYGVRRTDAVFVVMFTVHGSHIGIAGAVVMRTIDAPAASLVDVELQAWHLSLIHI